MKPIQINQWGHPDHYNLECGKDGIIRVKDGRTLEEYINSPELIKDRKEKSMNHGDQLLIAANVYERVSIPNCA
jgi:hypothetical protein